MLYKSTKVCVQVVDSMPNNERTKTEYASNKVERIEQERENVKIVFLKVF